MKNTRSSTDHYLLCTPPLSKDCSNTFLERSFLFSAPHEWSRLDESIRKSDFNMFKKSVKKQNFSSNVMNADSLGFNMFMLLAGLAKTRFFRNKPKKPCFLV